MESQFSRTALLLGENAIELLWSKRVALFGAGGVGGFAAEALIRAGIGALDVFDNDTVNESNLNRQIIALHSTIGMSKVEAIKARLNDISPNAQIGAHQMFYLPENADQVDFARYDYIIDCIDTVKAKVDIAVRANLLGIPIISAMGAGNKLDPTKFEVADLYETSICPPRPRNAQRVPQARRKTHEGCLFKGVAAHAASAAGKRRAGAQKRTGQYFVLSFRRGIDSRGRGRSRPAGD